MSERFDPIAAPCLVLDHILETCQSDKNVQAEGCQPSVKPENSRIFLYQQPVNVRFDVLALNI